MTVTKEIYSASSVWTYAQVADLFRDAFIDSGLMTSWYDSFTSGSVENRILEVVYDAAKDYGTTYYWFQFGNFGLYVQCATGWNASTHVPVGTQYLDYFDTTTSSINNHYYILPVNPSSTVELRRYTSGIDSTQSWFALVSAGAKAAFTITPGSATLQPWLDLDRGFYQGFCGVSCDSSSVTSGRVRFRKAFALRRDLIHGPALVGNTGSTNYNTPQDLLGYCGVGHASGNGNSNYPNGGNSFPFVTLPVGFSSSNPAYPADSSPVFHSMPYSPYVLEPLPADFGMNFYYPSNTFNVGDTLVVSAGVEEWEVVDFANAFSAITSPSPLFVARIV